MESNTKTSNKESLKRSERCSNNRKKETTEQANNQKRKIAGKKRQKREKWKVQNKEIIGREKLLKI